jgi:uncharacterized protein YcfJ
MTLAENLKRIHPLVAVAAVSVTLFSLVGMAALTGVLPTSYGANKDASANDMQTRAELSRAEEANQVDTLPAKKLTSKAAQQSQTARAQQVSATNDGGNTAQRSSPAAATQTAHKPAPQNSPVGIGVGAVVGGVLGNQVGSGDGKTLATILGAVGGGYIGNEVAKRNQ